jgi:hypothetical protein
VSAETCATCGRPTRPSHAEVAKHPGTLRRVGKNCSTCHNIARRGSTHAPKVARLKADLVEDLEWMAQTGESFTGAIRRCGVGRDYIVSVLKEFGRKDIQARLIARELVDA